MVHQAWFNCLKYVLRSVSGRRKNACKMQPLAIPSHVRYSKLRSIALVSSLNDELTFDNGNIENRRGLLNVILNFLPSSY